MADQLTSETERPKFRVIKAGQKKIKSGIIRVVNADGNTLYKGSCDRCDTLLTVPFPPLLGRDFVCRSCKWVAAQGKPSTKVRRKNDTSLYFTRCDVCETVQKTPFMPKKDRPFLCDGCYRESRPEQENRPKPRAPAGETRPARERPKPPPQTGGQDRPLHEEPCHQCGLKVRIRFLPDPDKPFFCPNCFPVVAEDADQKHRGNEGTRVLFHIECAYCGKREAVDFVPRSLSESYCSECFKQKPWRS